MQAQRANIVGGRLPLAALLMIALGACADGGDTPIEPLVATGNASQIRSEVGSASEPKSTATPEDPFAIQALAAVNQARAEGAVCGDDVLPPAGPVQWNTRVAYAALLQSEWMQQNNAFAHAWPDGTRVGARLDIAQADWYLADENIAAGFGTIDAAIAGWLGSPSHCRALMRDTLTELGVAIVPGVAGNTYATYWTMVLTRPPG